MAEVRVRYIVRKKEIFPNVPGDEVTFDFEMETMDPSIYDSIKSTEMIDGTTYDVEMFANERYNCSTINYSGDDLAEMKQFLYSVRGGYPFEMTNPDDGPIVPVYMNVKLIGRFVLLREARYLDDYSAQFIVQDFAAI